MIRFFRDELALVCVLIGFGFCAIILSAILSGLFPFYGYGRIICLILSAIIAVILGSALIVKITRYPFDRKRIFLLAFFAVNTVTIIEYFYFTQKQDDVINNVITTIKSNPESYEILSDLPKNEVISVLKDDKIPKTLCGTSYFYGMFKLCVDHKDRKIDFIMDIPPQPGANRIIRAAKS